MNKKGNFRALSHILILLFLMSPLSMYSQYSEAKNQLKTVDNFSDEQLNVIYDNAKKIPNNVQLSIGLLQNENAQFYGLIRKDNVLQNIENHKSLFEIASITKVFTATLLADFVVNSELKLTDTINNFIDLKLKNNAQITFKQLANHTSGLPKLPSNLKQSITDMSNPYQNYKEEKLEKYLIKYLKLMTIPGKTYKYSNLGFGVLDYTLRKYSKKNFEQLLQDRIFSKYGMENSTTVFKMAKENLVVGLDQNGNPTPNWTKPCLKGSGSIMSNVEDLSKFVKAHFEFSDPVLRLTRMPTFIKNMQNEVGLGWQIKNRIKADQYWHNGASGGYSSIIVVNAKDKESVIILMNLSDYKNYHINIKNLAFELMNTF